MLPFEALGGQLSVGPIKWAKSQQWMHLSKISV